ncbi:MAG: class I SAM-dependent methyltransferase [Chloroflexota bacterium]
MRKRYLALAGLGLVGYAALRAQAREHLRERFREPTSSLETAEDVAVAEAYLRVSSMPQFNLLREYVARRVLTSLPISRALDVGSGPGHLAIKLAQRAPGLEVIGLDLSTDMVALATANAREAGVAGRVSFGTSAAENIPFPDGFFDLVTSTLSLHHWSDPVRALDEVARVLAPGGRLVVFDLRRDVSPPVWGLLRFVTSVVVPAPLRRMNEPLTSLYSSYTSEEARDLADRSHLTGWQVTKSPFWLMIESTNG